MAGVGLDTSVVVRLLVGAPAAEAIAAQRRLARLLDAGESLFVTDLVIAETYHALQHHYRVPREEVIGLLHQLLTSGVVLPDPPEVLAALNEASGAAGLVDRLIHARHRARGHVTLTLDARQAALDGAERV